ncbi:MAG TPA: hypothetical protein VFT81_06310, partial [Dermatophilaceae bacterium]|nr:hypothetical protein [Dermatophilaceae bacterium]
GRDDSRRGAGRRTGRRGHPPAPFRDSRRYAAWPVELFVHSERSLVASDIAALAGLSGEVPHRNGSPLFEGHRQRGTSLEPRSGLTAGEQVS